MFLSMTTTTPHSNINNLRYIYGQEQNHLRYLETTTLGYVGKEQLNAQRVKCHTAAKNLYDAGGDVNDQPWEVVSKWFA